ncbi:hypothetical protein ACKWTF_009784 [Chironomus riparius]
MFGNLLKEKLIIEENVRKLQNKYIALRQQSIIENNQSEELKTCVSDILEQKQKVLSKIKHEYTEIARVYNDLETLLSSTKETALKTEELIDNLAESLNLKFPEELTRKSVTEHPQIQNPEENQLDDNNIDKNVEEDLDSDKENSKVDTTPESSSDYFSPILQIRKSNPINDQLYTPAFKSQSNNRIRSFK